jgi:hypothetical protein
MPLMPLDRFIPLHRFIWVHPFAVRAVTIT